MRRIKITSGFTRIGNRTVRPADGPVEVSDAGAAHLVARGVAVYADEIEEQVVRVAQSATAAPPEPVAEPESAEQGVNTSETENASAGLQEAHLDPDQLAELTVKELRKMAEDWAVDLGGCRTKAEIIEKLCAEPVMIEPEAIIGEE